jgi:outer membrane receptor protein involved in Fe transport
MNKIFFTLFVLLSVYVTPAQTITGIVINKEGKPVSDANVLLATKDGTTVKGSITDSSGKYEFGHIKPGAYFITASATGFAEIKSKLLVIDSTTTVVTVDILQLIITTKNLNAVVVTAKKKFIEMQADKIVLNVENSIAATGNSAFEVIKKAPGVSSDKDDNLKLKGQAAAIYVDGKPFYLSGTQLAEYLKSLQADAISKIEIITNPSSKYDAQGSGGIINIKLKKNKIFGTNGTVNAGTGYGKYPKLWGGLTLNYRKNKVNIFGNGNTGHYESYNRLTYNSIINNNNVTTYQDRNNYWHPFSVYSSFKAGMDYSISKKQTLGFLITGNAGDTKAITDNKTTFSDQHKQPVNYINNIKDDKTSSSNIAYNINYKAELDTLGSELVIDADYATYKKTGLNTNDNYFLDAQLNPVRSNYTFRNNSPATVTIKTAKIDWTKHFSATLKMEAGAKTSFVKTDNNLIVDSLKNNNWDMDYGRSNHFIYEENLNAAYVNFTKEWKKWNVQTGLRMEQTHYKGNSVTINKIDDSSYISLFPSLFVTYKANEKNNFNFSYTRRISRPSYQSLNPFTNYIDPYTVFEGNPYLKPSFTNAVELKHGYRDFLFTSLSYNYTRAQVVQVVTQDKNTLITINRSENVGEQHYVSLNVSAGIPVTKWWDMDNSIGFAWGQSISHFPGYTYNTTSSGFDISTDNNFTLPKNYKIQTSIYYSTPYRDGITKLRCNYSFTAGIQKQFWNKKANVKLNYANFIGPSAYRAHLQSDKLDITWINRWEGKRISLSCNYKFGNSNIKSSRQRKTASQEESNRVNL